MLSIILRCLSQPLPRPVAPSPPHLRSMSDGYRDGVVVDVPLSVITRPLDSPVDAAKVCSLVETLRTDPDAVPPITLLWIQGEQGGNYYFSFGGCHRLVAHRESGATTVRALLQRGTLADLRLFLGASAPTRLL